MAPSTSLATEPNGTDVYVLLSPFRENVREFCILTRVLADLDAEQLDAAEGFYAPDVDAALVGLCFADGVRRRLGPRGIQETVARTGLPMVIPATLSPADAHRFFGEHLSRYDTYVQQYPNLGEPLCLVERIVRRLGEQTALRPRAGTESDYLFDLRGEVPLVDARKPTLPGWLRPDSAW